MPQCQHRFGTSINHNSIPDSLEHALDEATGALEAAVEMCIDDKPGIPLPSAAKYNEHLVSLPVTTAMKTPLYLAMNEQSVSKVELARMLHLDDKKAHRIINPRHATKVNTMERALNALEKRIEVLIG